jgi:hypothetical protein
MRIASIFRLRMRNRGVVTPYWFIDAPSSVSFVPSRVEGMDDVSEVTVLPDRLELTTPSGVTVYHFGRFGRSQEPVVASGFWRFLLTRQPPKLVAERDYFHNPPDRFFRFYTEPPITIFMPVDDTKDYLNTCFFKIQQVIRSGGFETFDLG